MSAIGNLPEVLMLEWNGVSSSMFDDIAPTMAVDLITYRSALPVLNQGYKITAFFHATYSEDVKCRGEVPEVSFS